MMNLFRWLVIALSVSMVVPLRAIAAGTQPTTKPAALELEPYESKENGFAFKRPKGWNSMGPVGGIVAMFLHIGDEVGASADTINVTIVHSKEPTKLDDVIDQMMPTLKVQFDELKVIKNDASKLDGKPARNIVFTANGITHDVEVRVVVCLVGQDVYTLMFQTVPQKYEQMAPTFDAVVDSFVFSEKAK